VTHVLGEERTITVYYSFLKDWKKGKGGEKWKMKRNDGNDLDNNKFHKKMNKKVGKNRPGKRRRQQKGR
jgi:hypothetical protein